MHPGRLTFARWKAKRLGWRHHAPNRPQRSPPGRARESRCRSSWWQILLTRTLHWRDSKDGRANIFRLPHISPQTIFWLIPCEADLRPGLASESICAMFLRPCAHRKRLPTLTTIPRANGGSGARNRTREALSGLPARWKNLRQLLWRDYFQLGVGAIGQLLVGAPSAKLRCVTKAPSLHVVIGHFNNQLGPQRFPRQVFT